MKANYRKEVDSRPAKIYTSCKPLVSTLPSAKDATAISAMMASTFHQHCSSETGRYFSHFDLLDAVLWKVNGKLETALAGDGYKQDRTCTVWSTQLV